MEFEGDLEVRVDTEISADREAIGVPLAKNDEVIRDVELGATVID